MPETILSWVDLLEKLKVDFESKNPDDLMPLVDWLKKNIKSTLSLNEKDEFKNIFNAYLSLQARDIDTIVDEYLGYTTLHKAAKLGFDSFISKLIAQSGDKSINNAVNFPSRNGNTPLHIAALFGHYEALVTLYNFGGDLSITNKDNKLPITLSCSLLNGNLKENKTQLFKFLLENTNEEDLKGVDNELGYNLLMTLIPYDNTELITEVLKKCPVLLSMKDHRGQNVLHHAIIQKSTLLVDEFSNHQKLLLDKTQNGSTTWHLACRYGDEISIDKMRILFQQNEDVFYSTDEHGKRGEDYLIARNLAVPKQEASP